MRGPLPLSDRDFAAVRANVLARIAQRRRRAPWRELAALAASVVVAVVASAARPTPTPILPLRFAQGQDDGRRPARTVARRRHRKPVQQIAHARIELHTADPDVRIIWITN